MGTWDKNAQNAGLLDILLMENAAKQAVDLISSLHHVKNKSIWLFMGGGNNGGDAACMARYLQDMGAQCLVLHTKKLELYSKTVQTHTQLAIQNNVPFVYVPSAIEIVDMLDTNGTDPFSYLLELLRTYSYPDITVDAILGTGFKGELRKKEQSLITFINSICCKSWILSIDIPSGMTADFDDLGDFANFDKPTKLDKPHPIIVKAHASITFQAAKPALLLAHARAYVGELFVRSIGIPKNLRSPTSYCMWSPSHDFSLDAKTGIIQSSSIQSPDLFHPKHKGESGHVLIYGTSPEYTGASILVAWGAIHTGVGLVTIVAEEEVLQAVQSQIPEVMTQRMQNITLKESRANVFLVGPGMGRNTRSKELFVSFLEERNTNAIHTLDLPVLPAIFDADALYFFADEPVLLKYVMPYDILTPHPTEAARILGMTTNKVQKNRFAAMEALKKCSAGIWVLKGAGTLVGSRLKANLDTNINSKIATDNCPTFICPIISPNLAIGGSGDVLAGCIAALLARKFTAPLFEFITMPESIQKSFSAASLGVQMHAHAGIHLQKNRIQGGAREIAKALAIL